MDPRLNRGPRECPTPDRAQASHGSVSGVLARPTLLSLGSVSDLTDLSGVGGK